MMKKSRYIDVCRKGAFLFDPPGSIPRMCFGLLLVLFFSCTQSPGSTGFSPAAGVQNQSAEQTVIKHSRGFSIQYFSNYKLVKILSRFLDRSDTLQYLLVQGGTPVPTGYPGAQVIRIPVQKLVVTSSMHVGLAEYAGVADIITGMADSKYVISPAVRKNMEAGKVAEVSGGNVLNDERVISLQPGLVMTMGSPEAQFSRYQNLMSAGIPVMINSEWLETDPLGRSEWVKLMAALTNKEALVNRKFEEMEQEYTRLANKAKTAAQKPSVIIGMPYKGSWYVPDGDSYMAQFLRDAGAAYHWNNVRGTGSLALDFETVSPVALKADFWLHPGTANVKGDIAATDTRYSHFKPFKEGTVYNNNKRVNDIGSNDFWESGVVNPHLVLADLIRILHPELLPDHNLVYYKQLP